VGDERHLTFFEMLGNFSFGGYFKERAIKLAKEFLDSINIEIDYVTVFEGDKETPRDEESAKIWRELGFSQEKGNLRFENKKENFWGPTGDEGPCGPTTEIYSGGIEIWNIVFNEYYSKNGKLEPLKVPGIDTGMGSERTLAVLNGKESVFETDLFAPIFKLIPESLDERKKRIIADHSRAINALIEDGLEPSNKEQGYVLRRLIRRIVAYEFLSEINFLDKLIKSEVFFDERNKFSQTIEKGISEYNKINDIDAKKAFYLYQSFGLPFDVLKELDAKKTSHLKREDFEDELKRHQELSRTASAGMFKGGLADTSEKTTKLHTAAHLMLAGLRKVLGEHVVQKGSNITAERLRFDFSHSEKMGSGQIKDVENFINGIIEKDLPVFFEEMPVEKAREINAMGVFESKYGEKVKVYFIGKAEENVSKEICGGPHVERTGTLGHFKITKEESSSSGVRRIKAILE
jgi:alanyl-tRNA synthetase